MRLKSEIWASALIRRVFAEGGYGAIERRGAGEAGAIFVRVRHRDGTETLFAPAPQAMFEAHVEGDRLFEIRSERESAIAVSEKLEAEKRFDPDLWIVEIEVEEPERYLPIMLS